MAAISPMQVTFMCKGKPTGKYPLVLSHPSSLDNESYYTEGNPDQAVVIGPINAQVTFFDDQLYRLGQNALVVSLKREGTVDNPVIVDVAVPRLGPGSNPDGIYSGQEDDLGWILHKHAQNDWVQNTLRIAGDFVTLLSSVVAKVPGASSWAGYVTAAGLVVNKLQGFDPTGQSDNSQVDNISSVLFGSYEG